MYLGAHSRCPHNLRIKTCELIDSGRVMLRGPVK
jgi:hypothetical protein